MNLHELSVLITGASRGLGFALARQLGAAGAKVVLVARDQAALDAAVAKIRAAGGEAHGIAADVADKDAVYAIAARAAALVGSIDVLVNNASTLGPTPMPLLLDTECEDLERVLAVNTVGPFRLAKALIGPMVVRGRGLVIHISSDAATEGYAHWGAYGASKAAQDQLARVWAAELEGSGVAVVSVDPGEMRTQMHAEAMPDADPATLQDPEEVAARLVALISTPRAEHPRGRFAATEVRP